MAERLAVQVFELWKPEYGEIIHPQWFWRVVDALGYLYLRLLNLRDDVMSALSLIAPATELKALEKSVVYKRQPLYTDELTCHRIIVQSPPDNVYCIYIGNSTSQPFVLRPGEQLTLQVRDPRRVYVRSEAQARVVILFEVVK